jgi:Ser/Thr protein kinase RdoA (MazF antagonist)
LPALIDNITAELRRQYGIEASIERLPGELDLNYSVQSASGKFVLKIMREGCDPDFVDMQIKAMDHVRGVAGVPDIPEIVRTISGASQFLHKDSTGTERVSWLISFLGGRMMADIDEWNTQLAESIGEKTAQLCKALADFEHPLLDRKLKWDLRQGGWIGQHLDVFDDADQRQMIEKIIDRYETDISAKLNTRPRTPIYGDANDMNVLVALDKSGGHYVSGIIDFGDMIRTPLICEPAIAMAYAMMRDPEPIDRGVALVRGFNSVLNLDVEEISMLLTLVKLRLATSVTNAAIETKHHPDNKYLSVSEAPAWQLLGALSQIDENAIEHEFRKACGL